ncbi:MAG: signal peptidase I [Rehaibacterium terrae]|uniref:signal peptidase I n=1 Tax=Rehaibacterium terrae TaxID=1341696 RepID=UPI003918E7EC
MSVDFATVLVLLSALTGGIWLFDRLLFAKRRAARMARGEAREPVVVEYARSLFPVIFIVLLVRSFIAEPFRIPSSSMMPTLLIGDFILVNKFAYGLRLPVTHTRIVPLGQPERGDVVVFRYPVNPRQDYIKRIVGLPGDQIAYRDKTIYINGEPVAAEPVGRYIGVGSGRDMTGALLQRERLGGREHQILQRDNTPAFIRGDGSWRVPEGHYFVMGDNRDNSEDSRFWGFVPEENLVGKAFVVWMNWDSRAGGIDFSRIGMVIR